MKLRLQRIVLPLDAFTLSVDLELTAPITAVFGPSGAGKTSLLDLIAGLRKPKSALIALDDRVLTDTERAIFVRTHQRAIGYVPQDLALFPHLNVRQNLLYGHRAAEAQPGITFPHIAEALEISALLDRGIGNLSGGEKQRVALARALLAGPRLLLLDEPMASLDRALKARLLPYLRRIRDEFHVPIIYVSHDADEVAAICDEVVVLERGNVVRRGRPLEVL